MTSLLYFGDISVHISPKDKNLMCLESTLNGLLKNLQDGISKPLGSQEIQEKKLLQF